ncbi:MAG: FAD-dependent oxidoreductase [Emcibacteraceae bacterium]|nr:FAD-dependent oxidoreductase [Emcibacteraceae bacterium]
MSDNFKFPSRRQVLAGLGAGASSLALASCGQPGEPSKKYDTIVIGAGLSGLHAARLLEEEGASVIILESSMRTGGRIFTMDDIPSKPDAGGMEIGQMYARARSTITDLNIELSAFPSSPPGMMINYGDHNTTMAEWADWEHNPLPETLKKTPPFALMRSATPSPNPLAELDSWLEKDAQKFDLPLSEYLKNLGDNDVIREMISISLQGDSVDHISMLGELRKGRVGQFERSNGSSEMVVGGASRLPEAMAKNLKSPIMYGKKVTHIKRNGNNSVVTCDDGSDYSAEHIICTVPYAVLKDIKIDAPLPALQQQAINEIPYLPATAFYFTSSEPYWENDGLPPTMWTNSVIERIFALASAEKPVAIFWGLINGNNALAFDKLSRAEQEQTILSEMARIRPASSGKITVHKIHSWTSYPHNKGAWAYWKPGQITKFGEVYHAPHQNIHFAGEHTATYAAGIEGAFESGERAAFEVLGI